MAYMALICICALSCTKRKFKILIGVLGGEVKHLRLI